MHNNNYKKGFVIGTIFLLFSITIVPPINADRLIIWDVTITCSNSGGQNDYVVFGEAPDANDGPPVDVYDVLKPPAPQTPYIRTWFNDNLPYPYDILTMDYRFYPDVLKVWNLTVHWMPSSGASPTTITISWDLSEFTNCEYDSVILCTEGGTFLKDMLVESTYVFSCPAYLPQYFKIICSVTENLPPIANPDSYSVNEDSTLNVPASGVLMNDTDPEGDPLTAVKESEPAHGMVTLNSNGGFTYIPTANYYGSDSFTYKAYDDDLYSNLATVTITIHPINDPPVVTNIPDQTIGEGSLFSPITLDTYVSDVDDTDAQMTWTYSGNNELTISIVNRVATITTPNADWYGSETITFRATDPDGLWDEDSATFTMTPVNDPPVANPDSYETDENTPLTMTAPGVLGNDGDIEGDTLTAEKVSDPTHGSVVLNSNGGFTYTPDDDYDGIDTFTYRAYDGAAYSNIATVMITILPNHPPNQPNTPLPSSGTTGVSITTDLSWVGGDPDPGDTVTYDVYFGASSPPSIVSHNQSSLSYDPGMLGYSQTYYWKIVAWDNHGLSTSGAIWSFTTQAQNEYALTLTMSGTGAGSIQASPPAPYYPGDNVTIWANASVGSTFTGFSGDISATSSPQTLVMNGNKVVDAEFTLQGGLTLTLHTSGSGSGTIQANASGPFFYGAVVRIWANASSGSTFSGFSGDLSGKITPQTLVMDGNKTVTAAFTISGGGGGGGGQPPAEENQGPIADISAGEPYQGFVNSAVLFDGSLSIDPDGTLTEWYWTFGDDTNGTGKTVTHSYSTIGTYNVTLRVTDDKGATNSTTTTCYITQPNRPPSKPLITGPISGTKQTIYTYEIVSTDSDNDSLQYSITWGDSTSQTSTFLSNGARYIADHSWEAAGRYSIIVTVTDNQTTATSESIVYIDALQADDIGYLLDEDNDGIYDAFFSDELQQVLPVQKKENRYLIDTDGDGNWDHSYSVIDGFTPYHETPELSSVVLIIIAVVVVAFLVGYLFWKRKSKK